MVYEYKCVGAPERGKRRRGGISRSECVAQAMEETLAAEARDGWEYVRTDLLPVEERAGWFGRTQEVHRGVMVFRRPVSGAVGHGEVVARSGQDTGYRFDQPADEVPLADPASHAQPTARGDPRTQRPLAPLRVPDRTPAPSPATAAAPETPTRKPLFARQPRVEPVVPPKGLG